MKITSVCSLVQHYTKLVEVHNTTLERVYEKRYTVCKWRIIEFIFTSQTHPVPCSDKCLVFRSTNKRTAKQITIYFGNNCLLVCERPTFAKSSQQISKDKIKGNTLFEKCFTDCWCVLFWSWDFLSLATLIHDSFLGFRT